MDKMAVLLDLFETQIIDMSVICQKAAWCDMDVASLRAASNRLCHSLCFSNVVCVILTGLLCVIENSG